MSDIKLSITVKEGRLIFAALAELPFKLVFELIGKINKQSNKLETHDYLPGTEITLILSKTDLEIIYEALSNQPYNLVSTIMQKIFGKKMV